mgnify:CR=1 FL=1
MNLDDAIQSSLKKNAMESAMQGVMANMGPKFEILATPKNAETVQQTVGKQVAVMDNSSLPRAVSTKEASSYSSHDCSIVCDRVFKYKQIRRLSGEPIISEDTNP